MKKPDIGFGIITDRFGRWTVLHCSFLKIYSNILAETAGILSHIPEKTSPKIPRLYVSFDCWYPGFTWRCSSPPVFLWFEEGDISWRRLRSRHSGWSVAAGGLHRDVVAAGKDNRLVHGVDHDVAAVPERTEGTFAPDLRLDWYKFGLRCARWNIAIPIPGRLAPRVA